MYEETIKIYEQRMLQSLPIGEFMLGEEKL